MKLNKIYEDNRGEIYLLTDLFVFPEITLFRTFQGKARGGCIHKIHDEYVCVLEGSIQYVWEDIEIQTKVLFAGETILIPKNTPHYFKSLSNSLVAEWGASPEEKLEKHITFRKIVDTINESGK
jgi:mannose-6-phosphate isomerase-like protein (cupin superfamily)